MRSVDIRKMTFSAILTAMSFVVCLFASFLSNMTFSVTAITGVFSVVAIISLGYKYAWLVYVATSILVWILLPNKECAFFYTVLFGHYPMLKLLTEMIGKKHLIRIAKFLEYVIIFALSVLLFQFLSGLPIEFNCTKSYLFAALFFAVFIVYDFCIGRLFFIFTTKLSKYIRFH